MKVLIFGASGGLGLELDKILKEASHEVLNYNLSDLDIRSETFVQGFLEPINLDLIIYAKGYEDLYKAEENTQLAYDVNAQGAKNLALVCKEKNIPIIYISTDYVFDGTKTMPYIPNDKPNPLNVYGKTKLEAEHNIIETTDKHYIIRTSKLFGTMKNNFIDDLIEKAKTGQDFKAYTDIKYTPTWTFTLAKMIDKLITSSHLKINFGLYHCTNSGFCSDFDLIAEVLHSLGLYNRIYPIKYEDTRHMPEIPVYTVLNCTNTPGIRIDWRDAFHNYLKLKGLVKEEV